LKEEFQDTPRMFHMISTFGNFEAKEVLNPLRSDNVCPYPFYQFQLYEEKQPALFLFDNNYELYLWHGWFDADDSELQEDSVTGTEKIRYNVDRRCALQTAINYWDAKYPNKSKKFKGYVVYAGVEPQEFTNLFPYWTENETARNFYLKVILVFFFDKFWHYFWLFFRRVKVLVRKI
jgi:supervillin